MTLQFTSRKLKRIGSRGFLEGVDVLSVGLTLGASRVQIMLEYQNITGHSVRRVGFLTPLQPPWNLLDSCAWRSENPGVCVAENWAEAPMVEADGQIGRDLS
jgi:hypothetical protein